SMLQFLDQPITDALIDAITESVNLFLRTLVMRGALIDGHCGYDKAKNPVTEIALGHLTFDITFMPPPP
ncbi:phage tail sheath subtilisin-like domain-containing protein, partial [Methylococcus sp. S1B]